LNMHHNLLPHKGCLMGMNHQLLHSRADRTKFGTHQQTVSQHSTHKSTGNFPTDSISLLYIV